MKTQALLIAAAVAAGLTAPVAASSDYQAEALAMYKQMMDRMQMEPSGDPDKDFVMMMIPHHQRAIDMAQLELKYGKDKKLLAMAKKIVSAQENEIKEMQAWQAKTQ
jgi:uncharacterized protein (DUF305 family)